MPRVAHRDPGARPKTKPPAGRAKPITPVQREILQDVWAYLVGTAGDGKGITSAFKIHAFALQLCYPRAGKWTTTKPAAYQKYAHDVTLRPWSTDGEKQLIFVALSSMEWNDKAGCWTLKRPIAEFANQIGSGRTRINDALNAQRDAPFPVLQIDSSPAFERGGQRYRGALTFALVRDPLRFAEARDVSRVSRRSAEDERRKALHLDLVKLQIARERGEITPREFAQRKALLTHQIKWTKADMPPPLVAVDALTPGVPPDAPSLLAAEAVTLKGKALKLAFSTIEDVYPKAATEEADLRRRARERWELLQPTQVLTDIIISDVRRRVSVKREDDAHGWAGVEARYLPDLHTYLRDELWRAS